MYHKLKMERKNPRKRRGKRKPEELREYHKDLQNILDELPLGLVLATQSKTHVQYLNTSVHSKNFPLPPLPQDIWIKAITVTAWTEKTYDLPLSVTAKCTWLTLKYDYDLVTPDTPDRLPLTTKNMVHIVSLYYGSLILFSTHMFL